MKSRRRIITLGVGAAVFFGASVLVLVSRVGPPPNIKGVLMEKDPSQIQRAVHRGRWDIVRATVAKHEFKLLFGLCIPDLTLGRIREIGSLPDRNIGAFGRSLTNPSSRAYALSGTAYSRKLVQYGLERTTNGWEVFSFGWQ